MDYGLGVAILLIGIVAVYVVSVIFNSAEFGIGIAVVLLAAVTAAKSPHSKDKG